MHMSLSLSFLMSFTHLKRLAQFLMDNKVCLIAWFRTSVQISGVVVHTHTRASLRRSLVLALILISELVAVGSGTSNWHLASLERVLDRKGLVWFPTAPRCPSSALVCGGCCKSGKGWRSLRFEALVALLMGSVAR